MRKFLMIVSAVAFTFSSYAQKSINIYDSQEEINSIMRTGLAVDVDLSEKDVDDEWKDKLKDYGKVNRSKNVYVVEEAEIPQFNGVVKLYSSVSKNKGKTKVFCAIDKGTSIVKNGEPGYNDLKELLHNFALEMYRLDINKQIEAAEEALEESVDKHEDVAKDGEKLLDDLEDNAEEKIDLEKELKENAQEKKDLESAIEQNKEDQKAALEEINEMKKAVQAVRNKLNELD